MEQTSDGAREGMAKKGGQKDAWIKARKEAE
jgi:hypothetical protein